MKAINPHLSVLAVLITALSILYFSAFKMSSTSTLAMARHSLPEIVLSKEREMWEAVKRKDADALKNLLREDSYEINGAGEIFTKRQRLQILSDFTLTEYTMKDVKIVPISENSALLLYKVTAKGYYQGKEFASGWSTVSSVWANNSRHWQSVIYHETPLRTNSP